MLDFSPLSRNTIELVRVTLNSHTSFRNKDHPSKGRNLRSFSLFFSMIYENCVILCLLCFLAIQAECLEFYNRTVTTHQNYCQLPAAAAATSQITFQTCLQCFINGPTASFEHVAIPKRCSPLTDLHCVELRFPDTLTFHAFIKMHSNPINRLFDRHRRSATYVHNVLLIYVTNDSSDGITRSTIQPLESLVNRAFHDLRLIMMNRGNRTTLRIDPDIWSVTFRTLQLHIHCSHTIGWNSVEYMPRKASTPFIDSIQCQPPNQPMISTAMNSTSTKPAGKSSRRSWSSHPFECTSSLGNDSFDVTLPPRRKRSKWILMISLVASGCLLVCLLLACYLSIFYDRDDDRETKQRRYSSPWNLSDSTSNRCKNSSFWICHSSLLECMFSKEI